MDFPNTAGSSSYFSNIFKSVQSNPALACLLMHTLPPEVINVAAVAASVQQQQNFTSGTPNSDHSHANNKNEDFSE